MFFTPKKSFFSGWGHKEKLPCYIFGRLIMKPKLNMEKRYVEADNWQIYKQIEPERRRDGKIVLTNPYFQTSGPAGGGGGAETLLPPYRDRTDRRHDQPAEHHAAGQCGPGWGSKSIKSCDLCPGCYFTDPDYTTIFFINPDLIILKKKKSLLLMISYDQACKHEGGPAKPDSTTPKRTYKECRLQEIYLK